MKTQSPSLLASFCRLVFANITKLKNKPTRSLVLFGLIAVATTGLASTASSAASLRQLILGLGLSHASGSAPQPKAALTNPVLTAPMPQLSSTMTVERRGHTATLLADGRALIVGGENGAGLINQSEIFDPSAGTFSVGGNLSSPRADHSATRLADGRVLVAGGRSTTGALNTTEIFDPTTGAFASGPAMSVARAGHSATLFADGRVLIAGGDANGSVEIFDPSTGNLSAVAANMNTARSMHSAALLADGRVLLVGGRTTAGDALSSGEIFDPSNSTFADAGSTKDTHVRAILRVLPDGKVQIIGGDVDHNAIEIYDPAAAIFGAHAHDIDPANDEHAGLIAELMSSPSRAALIHNGQTITELPGSNKALGAGGTDSSGNATSAATIYDSSPASVTTDVLDYPPGTPVIITGRGFQPNELVDLTFHEDPHTHAENVRTVQADASGNFTYNQYAPEEHDLGVVYILGAKGQSSGLTAQTTFHDAAAATVDFATSGLPSGVSITVNANFTNNGGNSASRSVTFSTPGPSASTGTLTGTSFSYTFPSSVTVSGTTYNFSSGSPSSPFTTGAVGSTTTVTGTYVLACTAPAVTIQPTNQTVTYGAASVSFTATASGSPTPTVQWQVQVGGVGLFTDIANVAPYSGVTTGTLVIANPTVSLSGNKYQAVFTNTCSPSSATSTAATLTVNPKDVTITPGSGQNKVYGASDPTLTYTHSALGGADTDSVFTGALARAAGENVGTYAINLGTLSAGGNYNLLLSATPVTFEIKKKDVTITPDSGQNKVYGASDPTLTYTHSALGGADTDSVFTGALARAAGENVGTYAINLGTLSAGGNYNTVLSATPVTFEITKATVTVTPNSGQSKVYGTSDPTLTYTASGLTNGDTTSVFTGVLSRAAGENVGTYAITLGTLSAGSNYNTVLSATPVTFEITKATVTVTPTSGQSKIWGTSDPTLTYTASGLTNGDTTSVFTGALSRVAGESVGTYAITLGTLSAGSNYNTVLSATPVTFEIKTGYCFNGFFSPIGGSVETLNGGSFANPVRAFKLGSTIPVKFAISSWNGTTCGAPVLTGIHTLQAIYYSPALDPDPAIDASPTDAATTGNQFRLTDSEWHFNLSTKGGLKAGAWLLTATLQDGSMHTVWISIKK